LRDGSRKTLRKPPEPRSEDMSVRHSGSGIGGLQRVLQAIEILRWYSRWLLPDTVSPGNKTVVELAAGEGQLDRPLGRGLPEIISRLAMVSAAETKPTRMSVPARYPA
jgi:hypothetical protein